MSKITILFIIIYFFGFAVNAFEGKDIYNESNETIEKLEVSFRGNNWGEADSLLLKFEKQFSEICNLNKNKVSKDEAKKLNLYIHSLHKYIKKRNRTIAENRFRTLTQNYYEILEKLSLETFSWKNIVIRDLKLSLIHFHNSDFYSSQQELGEVLEILERHKDLKDTFLNLSSNVKKAISLLELKTPDYKKVELIIAQSIDLMKSIKDDEQNHVKISK